MSEMKQYDKWLTTDDAAAIVIREPLISVEGADGVIFPATYAAAEDKKVFPGGYNIDPPDGDKNVCLVDSVGSQANRIEPLFAKLGYAALVPQIVIEAGEKSVNILEAGHRAGDAIVRCKPLQNRFRTPSNPSSRATRSTWRRLRPLRLSLASGTHVIRRPSSHDWSHRPSAHSTFNALLARRSSTPPPTTSDSDCSRTRSIRNSGMPTPNAASFYILGLSLVVVTAPAQTYLRQRCNLVPDIDHPRTITLVNADGTRSELTIKHADALTFAKLAAEAFGVGESKTVKFDPNLAKKDIAGESDTKATRKKTAKAAAEAKAEVPQ